MENIIKGIRQYYPVSDSSLEVLFSYMKKMELPKKHLLIHGGVGMVHPSSQSICVGSGSLLSLPAGYLPMKSLWHLLTIS